MFGSFFSLLRLSGGSRDEDYLAGVGLQFEDQFKVPPNGHFAADDQRGFLGDLMLPQPWFVREDEQGDVGKQFTPAICYKTCSHTIDGKDQVEALLLVLGLKIGLEIGLIVLETDAVHVLIKDLDADSEPGDLFWEFFFKAGSPQPCPGKHGVVTIDDKDLLGLLGNGRNMGQERQAGEKQGSQENPAFPGTPAL